MKILSHCLRSSAVCPRTFAQLSTDWCKTSGGGGSGNGAALTRLTTLPSPVLAIERLSTNSVRRIGTTDDPAFILQFSVNLDVPNWASASPSPAVLGTNNVVTNTTGDAQKFYRLFKP